MYVLAASVVRRFCAESVSSLLHICSIKLKPQSHSASIPPIRKLHAFNVEGASGLAVGRVNGLVTVLSSRFCPEKTA